MTGFQVSSVHSILVNGFSLPVNGHGDLIFPVRYRVVALGQILGAVVFEDACLHQPVNERLEAWRAPVALIPSVPCAEAEVIGDGCLLTKRVIVWELMS